MAKETPVWVLVAGQYADQEIVAVVTGQERRAQKAADAISRRRLELGHPSDLVVAVPQRSRMVNDRGEVV